MVERCIDRGTKLTVFTHRLQMEFAEREIPSAAVITTAAAVIATDAAVLNRYVVFSQTHPSL